MKQQILVRMTVAIVAAFALGTFAEGQTFGR